MIECHTKSDGTPWPDIQVANWAGTKRSLHLYAQMLGKIRLALSPPQPNWMFTPLYLTARGLTTGAVPSELSSVEARLDVYDSTISIERSNGERRSIALLQVRSVAEAYAALLAAINELQIECFISPMPQEVPDTTPLSTDRRPSEYDAVAVARWFRAFTASASVFDRWRSRFFGRSGIQVWWGALDVALILFSGKHVQPPTDRGYLMKYDLDAELMNVGLYLGNENSGPLFYGYIYPEPKAAESLPVRPADASWSTQLREWTLPYDTVRASSDPEAEIVCFLDSIYEQCFAAAGWERETFRYDAPPRSIRRSFHPPDLNS